MDEQKSGVLMLHLLGTCNLRCMHCYMEGGPSRRERLPRASVIAAIREAPTLGIGTLYLTGGEPYLYRGLREVLEAGEDPRLRTVISTNATLLTAADAAFLADAGIAANVSVDGDEAYHDRFRQHRGAFQAMARGVAALVEAGVDVTVVSTISQDNLGMVSRIAAWCVEAGVRTLRVQPLLGLGRGVDIQGARLSSSQLDSLVLELTDLGSRNRPHLRCALVGVSRRFMLAHPCAAYVCNGTGCHRGIEREIKKVVIREDGTVLPEATNLSKDYALGNLADAPLSKLVADYFNNGGYARFDALCRAAYAEILPTWPSAVVPWDEIISTRSRTWRPGDSSCCPPDTTCRG